MGDFKALFDLAPLPAYIFDDETLKLLAVNDAAVERYGYSREEFLTLSLEDLRPIEDRVDFTSGVRRQMAEPKYRGSWRHLTRGGEVFNVDVVRQSVVFGGRAARFVVVTDVTERLQLQREAERCARESHEQLRRLSARGRARREEDRTRIARELHDQLGQALAGLKIDLFWLADASARDVARENIQAKVDTMTQLVDNIIWRVRRISAELRPPMLDKLGLVAAIEWEAKEFERRAGIRTAVEAAVDYVLLDSGRATAVFRIVQEAMTNVSSHAQATRVDVGVHATEGRLTVSVSDNGRGTPAEHLASRQSLGLIGMRERAELLDGTVDVCARQPCGTSVIVTIPLADRRRTPRDDWA